MSFLFPFSFASKAKEAEDHIPEDRFAAAENHEGFNEQDHDEAKEDSEQERTAIKQRGHQDSRSDADHSTSFQFAHMLCVLCKQLMKQDRMPRKLSCNHSMCDECVRQLPIYERSIPVPERQPTELGKKKPFSLLFMLGRSSHDSGIDAASATDDIKENGTSTEEAKNDRDTETPDGRRKKYGYISCLECSSSTILGLNAFDDLSINYELQEQAEELVERMSKCADCKTNMSSKFCYNCEMFLCHSCSARIHCGVVTSKHRQVDRETLAPHYVGTKRCDQHNIECGLYCITCEALACSSCQWGKHRNHDLRLVEDVWSIRNIELNQHLRSLKQNEEEFLRAIDNLNLEIKLLEERRVAASAFVGRHFADLRKELDEFEQDYLEQIKDDAKDKSEKLTKQLQFWNAKHQDLCLRTKVTQSLLDEENRCEVIDKCIQHQKALKCALAALPELKQCAPSTIPVTLRGLGVELTRMASKVKEETFPRSSRNSIVISEKVMKNAKKRMQESEDETDDTESSKEYEELKKIEVSPPLRNTAAFKVHAELSKKLEKKVSTKVAQEKPIFNKGPSKTQSKPVSRKPVKEEKDCEIIELSDQDDPKENQKVQQKSRLKSVKRAQTVETAYSESKSTSEDEFLPSPAQLGFGRKEKAQTQPTRMNKFYVADK